MKLTPQHIEAQIAATRYISRDTYEGLSTLTICVLEMANGTKIVGQSACLDESTFDPTIGKELARADAVRQVWQLEGYVASSLQAQAITALVEQNKLAGTAKLVSVEIVRETLTLANGQVLTAMKDAYEYI
ncbi:MAG: Gp49 family protein [Pseudomonadota bacterium]|nr:Gp49 family protein [Pseudomonadota bacterium]